jgi:hypothetical protein
MSFYAVLTMISGFLEKLIVAELVNKAIAFVGFEVSVPCSQILTLNRHLSQPNPSIPHVLFG